MKLAFVIGAGILCVAGVGAAVFIRAGSVPAVTISTSDYGITSLKVDNIEFLQNADFRVDQVRLRKANGETYDGSTHGSMVFDQADRQLTNTLPWGIVKTRYAILNNRLTLTITTINRSDSETIDSLCYIPLTLNFPGALKEYDGSIPLLAHNVGQVAATRVSYGKGSMVIASEDIDKPLMVGFPWALNRPTNTQFPLSIHTGRVPSYPESYPTIHRVILPGGSDQYVVSLRFGQVNTRDEKLVGDLYKKFAEVLPVRMKWPDHRPIGAIFLATDAQGWATNPRGWFGDSHLNVLTPAGVADFRERLLALASGAIGIMRDMNAQGVITWDIEGQEFRHATTYIGDPRLVDTLAPEMAGVVDEYFERFRSAGLRTGISIRPQSLRVDPEKKNANQIPLADPTQLLADKIAYAKKRWGVTLIYIDSNVNATDPNPLDVSVIQKLAGEFPDCLLIPEHSNLGYYAYSAPYGQLAKGVQSTPDTVRQVYPNAFSVIYTADGLLDVYRDALSTAVKHGDILMYRTWFPDPQNEKVKALYAR
jgi:hypothetical protein